MNKNNIFLKEGNEISYILALKMSNSCLKIRIMIIWRILSDYVVFMEVDNTNWIAVVCGVAR